MKKEKRKWVKDEKRLIKLLYRTGIIDKYTSIDSLYWDYSGKFPRIIYTKNDYLDNINDYIIVDIVNREEYGNISRKSLIKLLSKLPIKNNKKRLIMIETVILVALAIVYFIGCITVHIYKWNKRRKN